MLPNTAIQANQQPHLGYLLVCRYLRRVA